MLVTPGSERVNCGYLSHFIQFGGQIFHIFWVFAGFKLNVYLLCLLLRFHRGLEY